MVLIQLLLPTTRPEATPAIAMAALAETGRELAAAFDGLTAYTSSSGCEDRPRLTGARHLYVDSDLDSASSQTLSMSSSITSRRPLKNR